MSGDTPAIPAPVAMPTPSDRYAAVVAALLGVRTDHAGARYDAAIEAALAAQRIDIETARELRWWQRASARAAQEYAATLVPEVLAACAVADAQAATEADELANSWQRAKDIVTGPADSDSNSEPSSTSRAIRWNQPTRLIAVPDSRPRLRARRESIEQTQQAVRAALRSTSIDLDQPAGKDQRDHANSASSA
jgi:hypothetical protein